MEGRAKWGEGHIQYCCTSPKPIRMRAHNSGGDQNLELFTIQYPQRTLGRFAHTGFD